MFLPSAPTPLVAVCPPNGGVSGFVRVFMAVACGLTLLGAAACGSSTPQTSAEGSATTPPPPSARELVAAPPTPSVGQAASPSAHADVAPAAPGSSTAASASAAPAASVSPGGPADDTPPRGKVSNIGMHIGGGPNDDVTKDPIRRSVAPHFEAFRRCYGKAAEAKPADFGIDLRIPRDGGKAQLTKPRSTLKDEPFKECVIHTFEGIEFLKPRGGETVVSYSLRFTP
jgi:hypothetical protein